MKMREIIVEGGNVWHGSLATTRIPKDMVVPTVKFLEAITGLSLLDNMLGSTGKAETSGDIDLAVSSTEISKEELITKLNAWAQDHDPNALTKKTGIEVHFRCPIAGKIMMPAVQVDFMFVDNMDFTHWIYRPTSESKFKNVARTILIASLAKPLNLRFSPTRGLADRKTDKPLTKGTDPNYISKLLLNKKATAKDLDSVENILAALKNDPQRDKKLEDARKTLPMYGVPPEVLQ
jgi:hypothetical protein